MGEGSRIPSQAGHERVGQDQFGTTVHKRRHAAQPGLSTGGSEPTCTELSDESSRGLAMGARCLIHYGLSSGCDPLYDLSVIQPAPLPPKACTQGIC
jgi:hypothetical protein